MKPVCVFYYGGWSTSVKNRFIATKPKYIVSDWGVWPSIPNADVAAITAAGITFCAYIPPGGMRGYKYSSGNTPQTPAMIKALIDNAVAKGFNGVFFDEGGVYAPWHNPDPTGGQELFGDKNLQAPGINSTTFYNGRTLRSLSLGYSDYDNATAELWKGLTFETGYTNYAKNKGLFVCLNLGINGLTSNLNSNVLSSSSVDVILSSEDYNTRGSLAPMGIEASGPGKCWVLSYNGSFDVSSTLAALNNGFAAAYCCESMGTLSSNYETYMAQIPDQGTPTVYTCDVCGATFTTQSALDAHKASTHPTGTTYTLTVTIEGQGSTIPAAGAHSINAGDTVTMQAVPAAGYKFKTWSWPGNDPDYEGWTENPTSWQMTENVSIVAVFVQDTTVPANTFLAGSTHTANVTIKITPASLALQMELWIGPNSATKVTSKKVNFTTTGANQVIPISIVMPSATGKYNAYVDILDATGLLIVGYVAVNEINIVTSTYGGTVIT